jgi:hypothetical protein
MMQFQLFPSLARFDRTPAGEARSAGKASASPASAKGTETRAIARDIGRAVKVAGAWHSPASATE